MAVIADNPHRVRDVARNIRLDYPDRMSMITIRLTGGQHEQLVIAAEHQGMSLNAWALASLLTCAEEERLASGGG